MMMNTGAHPDAGDPTEGKEGAILNAAQLAECEEEEEEEGGVAERHQEVVLGLFLVDVITCHAYENLISLIY